MRARVKSALDEPLLSPRDTDKRAGALGSDGVVKLRRISSLVLRHLKKKSEKGSKIRAHGPHNNPYPKSTRAPRRRGPS
jgi:hypothetical protein